MLGGVITWASSKQKTVLTSTVIAEYIAMASMIKETLWLKQLLTEIGLLISPIEIRANSQGVINLALNARFSQKTKHINIKYYFIRDHIEKKDIIIKYTLITEIITNILIKLLPRVLFEKLRA